MGLTRLNKAKKQHPIDIVEETAIDREWEFDRLNLDEIAITSQFSTAIYKILFSWMEQQDILHVTCCFDNPIKKDRIADLYNLLAMVNSKLVMGHFDFWLSEHEIIFRNGLLLPGNLLPSTTQIEMMLAMAVQNCESYFHSFRLLHMSMLSAQECFEYSLFETKGSA